MMIEIEETQETPNTPPALYAAQRVPARGRKIRNPNPVLSSCNLGEVMALHWEDKTGYEWEDQVVRPPDYEAGKRYPLVIQTYGSSDGFKTLRRSYALAFGRCIPIAARRISEIHLLIAEIRDSGKAGAPFLERGIEIRSIDSIGEPG